MATKTLDAFERFDIVLDPSGEVIERGTSEAEARGHEAVVHFLDITIYRPIA